MRKHNPSIRKHLKTETVDSKTINLLILSIKKQNTYRRKRTMQREIID